MKWLTSLLGGGLVKSIENVALEVIQTDKESAEAKALFVKTLDPNGKMRRDISRFTCKAYGFYLAATVILIFAHGFSDPQLVGDAGEVARSNIGDAVTAMKSLFTPITTAFGGIVGASFGVNGVNSAKGRP